MNDILEKLNNVKTKEFEGTILFVSHDRYFINKLANKILHIENKTIKEYNGNYDYFSKYRNK